MNAKTTRGAAITKVNVMTGEEQSRVLVQARRRVHYIWADSGRAGPRESKRQVRIHVFGDKDFKALPKAVRDTFLLEMREAGKV